jgi:RNA polymerase sigma factor (sigma-70 family)
MRTFDVQSIEIQAPFESAFNYIADPRTLPEWAHAFASVNGRRAVIGADPRVSDDRLEVLVEKAKAGDRVALDEIIRRIQQPIYSLAMRMLWHPEDARDATQETLIRIVTRLESFRGDSRFMTWAYPVAANQLLSCRQSRVEAQGYSFDRFAAELDEGLSDVPVDTEWPADRATLLEEVKVGCMLGMLTCLDRESRLAYVLGEILELDGPEASAILDITPTAFRKRLSRARSALIAFTRAKCGLVRTENACHCVRRLPDVVRRGRVQPDALVFADAQKAAALPDVLEKVRALDEMRRTAALYQTHSEPQLGVELLAQIQKRG